MKNIVCLLLILFVGSITCVPSSRFVVPFATLFTNYSDGSLLHPYSSIQQALDCIEHEYNNSLHITLHLYPTYYFLSSIQLNYMHSHLRLTTMTIQKYTFYETLAAGKQIHQRLKTATISGGVPITGWTPINNNTFSVVVPSSYFINQLFVNNLRIPRTRVPMNYSDYLYYVAPLNDSSMNHYGFQYAPGQFNYKSLTDAMVVIYQSFTESHHYIDRLITENNTVIFSNPSHYPIGYSPGQSKRRFHIENLCESLAPNSFCFDNGTKTIYLMTNGLYDPNKVQIIAPIQEIVVSIASNDSNNPVKDITIDNVVIQHGAWNITRTQVAEGPSAEFLTSAVLFIDNATSINIINVEVSHTGSYGVRIREGTSNINLISSLVNDTGAGGVWIGERYLAIPILANYSKVISNEISYGGSVFPSGVGVLVYRSVGVVVSDNVIHHQRYNGISIGDQSGYLPPYTRDLLIERNYVYDIGQHILCDQGGIYIIGVQPGTVVHGNVVKNVYSYSSLMWGIYLDNGASNILVSNNVVYNSGWAALFQHQGVNNTIINNVFARASLIAPPHANDPFPDGDVRIQNAEGLTSWIYTRNIVYDTFRGVNHTAVNLSPNVIAPFYNNLYYNPNDTQLLFGPQRTSFAEWQSSGQDNNSVIADPLFVGDVNQCDFFAVKGNSPAAKLGFVNITKLTTWTPGCGTDDVSRQRQFYHW